MQMRNARWHWIAIIVGLLSPPAMAGPWALWKGESYTSVSVGLTRYNEIVMHDRSRNSAGRLRFLSYSIATEFGLTDDWTVSLKVPYEVARGDNRTLAAREAGLGDLHIGARRQLWDEYERGVALAAGISFRTPMSDYRTDVLSAPGDGQTDVELRLLVGKTVGSLDHPAYWDVETGYRFRRGAPGDEFFLYIEGGQQLAERWRGRLFIDHIDQLSGFGLGQPGWTPRDFPSVEEDTDSIGAGLTYSLSDDRMLDVFYARLVHVNNTAIGWHAGVSMVLHHTGF